MNPTAAKPGRAEETNGRVPPLVHGDRLTREEFERRYEAMPHVKKAELLNGVVYMGSPVRQRRHGRPHGRIIVWLGGYEAATPGVEISDNGTVRLGPEDEPQPDVSLFVLPEHRGQVCITDDDYMEGAPELTTEVSASSARVDLQIKLPIYRRAGVREYIVWRVLDNAVDWFALDKDAERPLVPDSAGVLRSEAFPGLWLDVPALLRGDMRQVLAVLQQGIASPEHAAFVAALAAKYQPPANP